MPASTAKAKKQKAAAQRKKKGETQKPVGEEELPELPPLPAAAPPAKKKKLQRPASAPKTRARLARGAKTQMNYSELIQGNQEVRSVPSFVESETEQVGRLAAGGYAQECAFSLGPTVYLMPWR